MQNKKITTKNTQKLYLHNITPAEKNQIINFSENKYANSHIETLIAKSPSSGYRTFPQKYSPPINFISCVTLFK